MPKPNSKLSVRTGSDGGTGGEDVATPLSFGSPASSGRGPARNSSVRSLGSLPTILSSDGDDHDQTGGDSKGGAASGAASDAGGGGGSKLAAMWGRLQSKDWTGLHEATTEAVSAFQAGRLQLAAEKFERCLQTLEKLHHGKGHRDVAAALHNLGHVKMELGEYKEAEEYMRRGIEMNKALADPRVKAASHVLSRVNLSTLLSIRGAFEESEELLRFALFVCDDDPHIGPENPLTASVLNNLAAMLIQKHISRGVSSYGVGKLTAPMHKHGSSRSLHAHHRSAPARAGGTEADTAVEFKLAPAGAIRGGDSKGDESSTPRGSGAGEGKGDDAERAPALLSRPQTSGPVIERVGSFRRAPSKKSLPLREGDDSPELTEALELLQRALAIQLKALGEGDPQAAATLVTLAQVHRTRGDFDAAMETLKQALDHLETADAVADAAKDKKSTTAEGPQRRRSSAGTRERLNDLESSAVLNNMGELFLQQCDYEAAIPVLQKALMVRRRVLGERHADTACTIFNIGVAHAKLGHNTEALERMRLAHSIVSEALGPDHWQTEATRQAVQQLQLTQSFSSSNIDLNVLSTPRPDGEHSVAEEPEGAADDGDTSSGGDDAVPASS